VVGVDDGLDVTISAETGVRRVKLGGELDVIAASRLWTMLSALEGPGPVVVDLGDLSFIDSMGLSTLIRAKKRADGLGLDFRITNPSERVREIFQVVGLNQVLD
jgi:anti-sigma B factor antagonist